MLTIMTWICKLGMLNNQICTILFYASITNKSQPIIGHTILSMQNLCTMWTLDYICCVYIIYSYVATE